MQGIEGIYANSWTWLPGRFGRHHACAVGYARAGARRDHADPRQVYIAGISNGGMMTFRMLCEASELFAGAATVIANMPANVGARCAPRKPLPVVMFNGTADPLVPYDGGGVGFLGGRG